jgi:hypothetical protein
LPGVEIRSRLDKFRLRPSALVLSGGGVHVYWWLHEPLDLRAQQGRDFARLLLRSLATFLGADIKSAEPAHILRLPGTLNHKYAPARPVTLDRLDVNLRYHVHEFSFVPLLREEPERDMTPVQHSLSRDVRMRLAHEWLSHHAPAIEGQGGDAHTFAVCCGVAHDHDLSEDDALAVLRPWNATCRPPWTERDLRQKVRGAVSSAKGRRGAKLLGHLRPARAVSMLRGISGLRGIRGL